MNGLPNGQLQILVLAPNAWIGPWMNRQHLFSRLGRKHVVLYSNGLWDSWDRHTPSWRAAPISGSVIKQDGVLLDSPPRFLMRLPQVRVLDQLALKFGTFRWRQLLGRLRSAPLICYVYHPKFWPYLPHLRPQYVVYHAYDRYDLMEGWTDTVAHHQALLMHTADLILASSEVTARALETVAGRRVVVLPNGVDFEPFRHLPDTHPHDLNSIPRPRIGYAGALNTKVDFALLSRLSITHPDWQFVLIGSIGRLDKSAELSVNRLRTRSNVHFLGFKDRQELPGYLARMDVNIVPYRIGEGIWSDAGAPNKIYEYLACGQPVVSADLVSARSLEGPVMIARADRDWERSIHEALRDDGATSQVRRAVALENTWEKRVEELNELLLALGPPTHSAWDSRIQ